MFLWKNKVMFSFNVKSKSISHSVMSDSVTPWTLAHQAPLSMGFSGREYWSGLPFASPGDLPDPGIEPASPALQTDSLLSEPPGKYLFSISSVQFSHWVMSSSLWPHGLQHAWPPCPSPTPRAYLNSCPSSWWSIQLSHPLLSPSPPTFNLSQHQDLFQGVSSSHQVAKVLEFQLQPQSFQWIFRTDFL